MNNEVKSQSGRCWNTIGVWGDSQAGRCEKLADVIHCRNCNVYWEAGRAVFERHVPDSYVEEWTRSLASIKQQVSRLSHSIIFFRLGQEWFSFSTRAFVEVSQVRPIHSIPHQSSGLIKGVVNVGGSVKVCFSLSHVLGVDDASLKTESGQVGIYNRFVVVKVENSEFVFPVDEVAGVHRYDPDELKPVPATVETVKARLLLGVLNIGNREVACIDVEKLAQTIEELVGG